MESWKSFLNEAEFSVSPDEDGPGRNQIVFFSPDSKYEIAGDTHGGLSHSIKHYGEFEPDKMKSSLDQALKKAATFNSLMLKNIKTGETIATGEEAKVKVNHNAMLNTFDFINDKIKNNEPLNDEEKSIVPIISSLNKQYQNLVDFYISSATDIKNIKDVAKIKNLLDAKKIIKFIGSYGNKSIVYYLNPADTGLVASDGDEVFTLFRVDKKGSDLSKILKKVGNIENTALKQVLSSYAGRTSLVSPQKKKQPKPQKQKTKPGDIVRRLKAANKPDEQIRQILKRAFPKLPEKAIDNMLANIK